MNESEYERTYDASDSQDELEYEWYLWWRHTPLLSESTSGRAKIQGEQSVQQGTSCEPTRQRETGQEPVQEEAWLWQSWEGPRGLVTTTRSGESISERVLRATGTQASDWSEGYGSRPGLQEDEGDTQGSGQMALQRMLKIMQGAGEPCAADLPSGISSHADDIIYNLRYNLYPRGGK